MPDRTRSTLAAVAHLILQLVLGLVLAGALVTFVPFVIDSISGNGQTVMADQTAQRARLEELHAVEGCSSPECIMVRPTVPVQVVILNANGKQLALDTTRLTVQFGLVITGLWIFRNLVASVGTDDPFTRKNVGRLRALGFLLLVGGPGFIGINKLIDAAIMATTKFRGDVFTESSFAPTLIPMVAGLSVLILAEVFAHGVRLREDVEGTI